MNYPSFSYQWRRLFRLLYCLEFTGSSSISSIASILSSESSLQYPEVRRESLLPFGEIGEEGLEYGKDLLLDLLELLLLLLKRNKKTFLRPLRNRFMLKANVHFQLIIAIKCSYYLKAIVNPNSNFLL